MKIDVKLFGDMQVKINDELVVFPFKKAAILFAYLIIYKQVERSEIANILWENVNENEERKNLRNAIYTLRKVFSQDIIQSNGNKYIYLNPDYEYNCDYYTFMNTNDPNIILNTFDNFLNDQKLDKVSNYVKWSNDITNDLLNIYISSCDKLIYSYLSNNKINEALDILLKKVNYYIYDEIGYREIMQIYFTNKEYDNAIEAYKKISKLLNNDLKINCEIETIKLYEKILNAKQSLIKEKSINLISESNLKILNTLINSYETMLKYSYSDYYVIHGDMGSGKRFIINQFLSNIKNNASVFKIRCYENDNDYVFRSIIPFILELSSRFSTLSFYDILTLTFKESNKLYSEKTRYQYFDEHIIKLLKKITLNTKIIIVVEDAFNMDISSIKLFQKLIDESLYNIMIIFSYNSLGDGFNHEKIKTLKISGWQKSDVEVYIKKNNYKINDKNNYIDTLLKSTNGNPFYIKEFLKSSNIYNLNKEQVFSDMYLKLNPIEKTIVELLTIFTRSTSINNLKSLVTLTEMELIDAIRKLEEREIVLVNKNDLGITYQINNIDFKKYVYNNINKYVRRQLHNVVAKSIEDNDLDIQSSLYLYQILIDQYSRAENKFKELENKIKYHVISNYVMCELFTIIEINLLDSLYLEESENFEEITNELEAELISLSQNNVFSNRFKEMAILFYTMKARYYLQHLDNEKSYDTIMLLIKHTEQSDDVINKHNAYFLMIYYSINAADYETLKIILDKLLISIQLLDTFSNQYSKSIITYYRFRGFYYMNKLDIERALDSYQLGLEIIEDSLFISDFTYKASIYHYLGQAYLIMKDYEKSIHYFKGCLELLGKDNLLIDAILTTKGFLAIAYYLNNDYNDSIISAKEYINNESRKNFYLKNRLFNQSFEKIVYNKDINENVELDNKIDYLIYKSVYEK